MRPHPPSWQIPIKVSILFFELFFNKAMQVRLALLWPDVRVILLWSYMVGWSKIFSTGALSQAVHWYIGSSKFWKHSLDICFLFHNQFHFSIDWLLQRQTFARHIYLFFWYIQLCIFLSHFRFGKLQKYSIEESF